MRRSPRVLGPVCTILVMTGSPALAQPSDPEDLHGPDRVPETPPTATAPPAIPAAAPTLTPVRPGLPGSPVQELGGVTTPPLLIEGAFVSNARGQLVTGRSGHRYLVFDADAEGRSLPPMVMLPNLHMATLERAAERAGAGARMLVTGRVTFYHDRNFLLLTAPPTMVRAEPAPDPRPEAAPSGHADASPPPPDPAATTPRDPAIERLIGELDDSVAASKGAVPAPLPRDDRAQAESAENGAPAAVFPTGYMESRRGRVVRGPDGAWQFALDAGAGGRTEGPIRLLPCANLMAIENVAQAQGEGITYTMSGQVFVYNGRTYLLPTMYVVNRPSDLVMPAQ